MAFAIYSQFKVDIESLVRSKVHIARNFHISPQDIESLSYWEYEYMVDEMRKTLEKEEKQRNEDEERYNANTPSMRDMRSSLPKTPKMSTPKLPKLR